jgi:hypothetical protein
LIIVSSVLLICDQPLDDPNGPTSKVLGAMDAVLTGLFFMEASIKIIAKGLLFNRLGPI